MTQYQEILKNLKEGTMKTKGNDLNALNDKKFENISEKMLAIRKLSATYMELEGSEKQVEWAENLVEKTFGYNLTKLDRLIESCEKFKEMTDYPLHKELEKKLELWEKVKKENNAGRIIEILKN